MKESMHLKVLTLFTHPHVFLNLYFVFCFLMEYKEKIPDMGVSKCRDIMVYKNEFSKKFKMYIKGKRV